MYKYLFVAAAILAGLRLQAQSQDKKRFIVNPGEKLMQAIPRDDIYRYHDFQLAEVTFKDGRSGSATLNYNSVFGEMQFVDPKGDTVSVADENNIRWIAVGRDTFYFQEGWMELLAANSKIKLARKKLIRLSNKEMLGGRDIPTFGAVETNTKSTASQQTRDIVATERLTYTEYYSYYFADRFYKFFPATKKSLLKIYGEQQQKIEQYLEENKIDFTAEADLKRLSVYLQGL